MAGIRFWRFKRHLVDIQDKKEIGRKRRSFTNISLKCLTDSLSFQTITTKSLNVTAFPITVEKFIWPIFAGVLLFRLRFSVLLNFVITY